MSRTEKIAIIRDFIPRLEKLVEGLSAEQLTTQYNAPEWTVAQNIHHLADAHVNSYLFFMRVLTEDQAQLKWPNQDQCSELPGTNSPNLEPSLTLLHGLHARWAYLLENIEDWSHAGARADSGDAVTLDDLLDIYSGHCDAHYQQIQEVMDKMS